MKSPVTAPRLSWDELKEGLAIGSQELLGKLSVRSVLSHSWEAGGVYPTLLGYSLGAIATFSLLCGSHWSTRLIPTAACFLVLTNAMLVMENASFALLLAFAVIVGVGCTYVQVVSWQQAFAGIARRRKATKKSKFSKVNKVD